MTGAGYLVNINDIAGSYSGIVFGISNTIATVPGILSPYVAGALTKHVNCYFINYSGKTIYKLSTVLNSKHKKSGR
jgi:hypothetical protein